MAGPVVEGEAFAVRLTAVERLEAVHGDVEVPRASVRTVEVLDDVMGAIHGEWVWTGIPGVIAAGTFTSRRSRAVAVVHHNTRRGVRVTLVGERHQELIVGCASPEAVTAGIPGPG